MDNSKKLMEIIYKFVFNMKDEDLEKLLKGENELTLKEVIIKEEKKIKVEKSKVRKEKTKEVDLNSNDTEDAYNKIRTCENREEAKKILLDYRFTKSKLLEFGDLLKVNLPKSATKDKIADKIVDIAVGWSLDRNSISKVKLK